MRYNNLNDWLTWQETLNPAEIELGLERVSAILKQAGLSSTFNCPLITVAGTNGKGSVVAMLEAISLAAGLNVCSYTSPHLIRYNERIRINGSAIDDAQLCAAFERIDKARIEQPIENNQLTYFEFGTLAAIDLFTRQQPDLVILEVGLGGRLDAVNVMDADISILTSVAIDHVDWLGNNRETIGFEKAGIFRHGQTVICGDKYPPDSVIEQAQQCLCEFIQYGQNYSVFKKSGTSEADNDNWMLKSDFGDIADLPPPSLPGDFQKINASTAILALQAIKKKKLLFTDANLSNSITNNDIPLTRAIKTGLERADLPGRFQIINTNPLVYVDVAHNPQAAESLASQLRSTLLKKKNSSKGIKSKTWAITAMLSDKDVEGVISNVTDGIDNWCFAGLEKISRGMTATAFIERLLLSPELSHRLPSGLLSGFPPEMLKAFLAEKSSGKFSRELASEIRENQCKILSDTIMVADTVDSACKFVLSKACKSDRIIIFGSFYTVSEAMQFFNVN